MPNSEDQIIATLNQHQKMLEEQEETLKSIQRWARVSSAFNIIRFLIVAIPVIFALLILPRYVAEFRDANIIERLQQLNSF